MVFTDSYVVSRVVLCSALTNNNVPRDSSLTTENFHS